jgi:arylsulfatase A-like enzyme
MSTTIAIYSSLCLGLILSGGVSAAAAAQPNLLFILVDDQRNDTLGCAAHPVIKTPNIDQLARQGVRFQNAFVTTSICMASRASIFTGLTETGHGYTGGGPPATPVLEQDVDTSFPVLLVKAGYRTGFFGKQHVKFEEGSKRALERMFEQHEVIGRSPYFKKQPDGSLRHEADLIGDRSVEFLTDQKKDQPFCLYMSFNTAHAEDRDKRPGIGHFPWPKSVDGMYEDIDPAAPRLADARYFDVHPEFLKTSLNRQRWYWRWDTPEKYAVNMRAYYRMLTGMDNVVGRVTRKLEEVGLADNTVIIYTADNGYYMGDRGFAGKWSHYEQSLRVPLIVHDPRLPQQQRGRVVEPLALNIDLPATMLQLAGVDVPDVYQGHSLVPIMQGEKPTDWRADFFCEHHVNNEAIPKWHGVRGSRFTNANYYEQEPAYEFLFDLETDPDQLNNLASHPEHQNVLNEMRERRDSYVQDYTRPEIIAAKQGLAESTR